MSGYARANASAGTWSGGNGRDRVHQSGNWPSDHFKNDLVHLERSPDGSLFQSSADINLLFRLVSRVVGPGP